MMKTRLLLAYLLFAPCMALHAQSPELEYRPFAEDGKVWESQVGGIKENVYGNQIDGDTLIGGETWKKVYNYVLMPELGTSYYAAIRDVGKKVYAVAKGSDRPRLLYDFGLREGDLVRCGVEGNAFGCLLDKDEQADTLLGFPLVYCLRVERIDTVLARGLQHRRFTLTLLDKYKEPLGNESEGGNGNVVWVEGVGSGAGPFSPWLPLPPAYGVIHSCEVNRTCIFGSPDFRLADIESGIGDTRSDVKKREETYDFTGRKGTRRTPYIKGGRKYMK